MPYLYFRTDDRPNDQNGRHEYAGDLVGYLPDDHLARGGDFGAKGRREFVWIRVTDCPDEDMLRGLCAEEYGGGRRRRFNLNRLALRAAAAAAAPARWHDAAWDRATDVLEQDCPTVPWSSLVAACRDRDTGRKPHERRLAEHHHVVEIARLTKEIDDDVSVGRVVSQAMYDERAVAMARRDSARSAADRAEAAPGARP